MVSSRILRNYIIPAIWGLLLGGSFGVAIITIIFWFFGASWGFPVLIVCAVVFVIALIGIPFYSRYAKKKTKEEELQEKMKEDNSG